MNVIYPDLAETVIRLDSSRQSAEMVVEDRDLFVKSPPEGTVARVCFPSDSLGDDSRRRERAGAATSGRLLKGIKRCGKRRETAMQITGTRHCRCATSTKVIEPPRMAEALNDVREHRDGKRTRRGRTGSK